MVRSIDDAVPEFTYPESAAPSTFGSIAETAHLSAVEPPADAYAEAELRLRHERTERFIEKANRDQG